MLRRIAWWVSPRSNYAAATVTLSWSGLAADTRYLGEVEYTDGTDSIGSTIVAVNP